MKNSFVSFIKGFSFLTVILLLLSITIYYLMPNIQISNSWLYILLFLYLFTLFAFSILEKYIDGKLTYFANAFMLVNFGKLLLFSIIIIVYAWLNHDDAISFAATFFIYYFVLTTYEIIALLKSKQSR